MLCAGDAMPIVADVAFKVQAIASALAVLLVNRRPLNTITAELQSYLNFEKRIEN